MSNSTKNGSNSITSSIIRYLFPKKEGLHRLSNVNASKKKEEKAVESVRDWEDGTFSKQDLGRRLGQRLRSYFVTQKHTREETNERGE